MTREFIYKLVMAAQKAAGERSERQFALKLGLSPRTVSGWRMKDHLPTDAHIVTLSKIAGVDPMLSLLRLSALRATGEAALLYEEEAKQREFLLKNQAA